jgi:TetR/AcrR family transcriptional regulator
VDNRSKLLDCALTLFSARGYDAVGVQEIAETAEVTKPTLYHYFSNKRGLLDALLENNFVILLDSLHKAAAYQGDLTQTLQKIVQMYFEFAKNHPRFYRMQLSMYFAPPDSEPNQAILHYSIEQYKSLESLFILATKEHGNMRGRHQSYATTFLGMINTYIGMYLNGYTELDDALTYRSVHQFMHGILS